MGADLHLNFPFAASDSYVDAVARIDAGQLPGRTEGLPRIHQRALELGLHDLPVPGSVLLAPGRQPEGGCSGTSGGRGRSTSDSPPASRRKGRGAEVRSILNMQLGAGGGTVRGIVKQALDEGLPPPDIAIAPYVDFGNQPSLVKAFNVAEPRAGGRPLDLESRLRPRTRRGETGRAVLRGPPGRVDAVNKEFGTSVELYGYEGGASTAWPLVTTTLRGPRRPARDAAVADASLFSPGQFLRVGPEWVRVRRIAGNVLTVDRAQAGTAAAAYKAGAAVRNSYVESSAATSPITRFPHRRARPVRDSGRSISTGCR